METEDNKTMEPGLLEALADQKDDLKPDVGRIWLSEEDWLDEWDGDDQSPTGSESESPKGRTATVG